jgi:hypothetical protein
MDQDELPDLDAAFDNPDSSTPGVEWGWDIGGWSIFNRSTVSRENIRKMVWFERE